MEIRGQTIDQVADLMSQLSGDLKFVTKPCSSASLGTAARHVQRREVILLHHYYNSSACPCLSCLKNCFIVHCAFDNQLVRAINFWKFEVASHFKEETLT